MVLAIVLGGLVLLGLLIVAGVYNSFIGKRNNVKNAYACIDVQLKKRCDLVPNLVACVKRYMEHEKGTLERIVQLRSHAMEPGLPDSTRFELDSQMSHALKGLMVQVESYPDLRASENVQSLQRNLSEIEEQLSAARRAYNASVTEYNNAVEMFPGNLFAGIFGFTRSAFFEVAPEERNNPNVGELFQ